MRRKNAVKPKRPQRHGKQSQTHLCWNMRLHFKYLENKSCTYAYYIHIAVCMTVVSYIFKTIINHALLLKGYTPPYPFRIQTLAQLVCSLNLC